MVPLAQGRQSSPEHLGVELSGRLRVRRAEIEQAVMTRVYAVADAEPLDPEYAEGLRAAVAAAVDYGLAGIELGEERAPDPPPVLLSQARMAARNGISLDTVLRRYFAGYTLLGDFALSEAEEGDLLRSPAMQLILRAQAVLFDRLVEAVTEEYGRELRGRVDSAAERRAKRVSRLLTGELLDTADLRYDFEARHLGLIATGAGAAEAIRAIAKALDRSLLAVHPSEDTLWAWLGGRRATDPGVLEAVASELWPTRASLAVGEPAEGLAGWRFTHRQARAALPMALRNPGAMTRYATVALLASMLQDDLLATSLQRLYLAPLECEHDDGATLRDTLRAYFAAGRNGASTAAALGVSRQTIANRLHAVEERLGRPLSACVAELEAALRLEDIRDLPALSTA